MSDPLKQKYIHQSIEELQRYIEAERFKGFDPYDTLTSTIPFHLLGKWGPIIATQIQKRNPFNIRKLIGIKKEYNPKGLGLLLHSYAILQQKFPERTYKKQLEELYKLILEKRTIGYSGTCWGYNFGWASPVKYLKPYAPTIVVTAFIAKGLYAYYKVSNKEEIKDLLLSIAPFILKDLPHTITEDGVCISYSTSMPDCCYNASLLAAETLAILFNLDANPKYKQLALEAIRFVINHQHSDGHWGYSLNIKTAKERKQTDFHQGFVLESIWNITQLLNHSDAAITKSLQSGIDFYVHKQFSKVGRSYWRLPSKYPTDIHHQAQGIITLARMSKFAPAYAIFGKTIAAWTIENMQDPYDGHFYFKKMRFYTNKISFMRWGQAWMFLALAEIIQPEQIKK